MFVASDKYLVSSGGGGGGSSLAFEDLGRMFDQSFPASASLSFFLSFFSFFFLGGEK